MCLKSSHMQMKSWNQISGHELGLQGSHGLSRPHGNLISARKINNIENWHETFLGKLTGPLPAPWKTNFGRKINKHAKVALELLSLQATCFHHDDSLAIPP